MKALLLAAGFGKRLGKITQTTPKPLIKVGEEPLLGFCLKKLSEAGISEVIINTHYLASQIEDYVKQYKSDLNIQLSYEEDLLGTAGTLKMHIDYFANEDFIVMHSDNYFTASITDLVSAHKSRKVGRIGTLGTFKASDPTNCGIIVLNSDKTIKEFHEKVVNPPSNIANTAIYVFTPEVVPAVRGLAVGEIDLSKNLIPKIMNEMYTYNFDGLFVDIGTAAGLQRATVYEAGVRRSSTF